MTSKEPVIQLHRALRLSTRATSQKRPIGGICSRCLYLLRTQTVRDPIFRRPSLRRPQLGITSSDLPARRKFASAAAVKEKPAPTQGPLAEYDRRVDEGLLRDDAHQRSIITNLQDLHDAVAEYTPPPVIHPTIASLQPPAKRSLFSSWFAKDEEKNKPKSEYPEGVPKGIYMYGDVGSGKTMMMDLFYDTLPPNITHKSRLHFQNFMQGVHKELHKIKMQFGNDFDAVPFVAAKIAEESTILCFDEFQCTDVADAMILRRFVESLLKHGVVVVTTSNRHPDALYENGIQRQSFIPCINLLKSKLQVINLDSSTDYRKIPRPASDVYHHPLNQAAKRHADQWFKFFGDIEHDPPHATSHEVWGRKVNVPKASGKAAMFKFDELIGQAKSSADYLELVRNYEAFIITDVPGMNHKSRDLARRFITFIDAAYEGRAKVVMTMAVPLTELFLSHDELDEAMKAAQESGDVPKSQGDEHSDVSDVMRSLMDDLGMNMNMLKNSSIFTGDEERFAFARALSRLVEMGSKEWVERGMGLESKGGKTEQEGWKKVRSRWREDSY